jgi:protein involved in polysaccharide export with SLBB domain
MKIAAKISFASAKWAVCFFAPLFTLAISYVFFFSQPAFAQARPARPGDTIVVQTAPQESENIFDLTPKMDTTYIPYDYPIGNGDKVAITVEIAPSSILNYSLMVNSRGEILLPIAGAVHIEGLTADKAGEVIASSYKSYYNDVYVNLQIREPARIRVYFRGDTNYQGVYIIYSHITMLELLQYTGYADKGWHRRIRHIRPGGDVYRLSRESRDLSSLDESKWRTVEIDPLAFSRKGQILSDFLLKDGDIVEIPRPEMLVRVSGAPRSGLYEVLEGETLSNILEYAGSVNVFSDLKNTVVQRYDAEGQLLRVILDLRPMADGGIAPDFELQHRDEIKLVSRETRVFVFGSVQNPGTFDYSELLTVYDYIAMAGPSDEAHLPNVMRIRQPRDLSNPITENDIVRIDFKRMGKGRTPLDDYSVLPGDVFYVPDKSARIGWKDVVSAMSAVFVGIRVIQD